MITLIIVKNPFKSDREIKKTEYVPSKPVYEYIQPYFMGVDVVVSRNGEIVPEEEYRSLIPAPGDYIAVCPVIEGSGDSGKDIARAVAVIALTVVTMGVGSMVAGGAFWGAGAIGAANWGLWSWVAAAGVQIAGGYLINQWFPVGQSSKEERKQVYGWSQLSPISTEGEAVPVTFGKVRMGVMAPIQILTQRITTDGEKQYLNLLLCGGEGPVDSITDLTINDNPYTNYEGVEYEERLGTNDQEIISNFNDTYFPQSISYKLEEGAGPSVHQLNGEYEGIEVVLDFPRGLYRVDSNGEFKSTSVEVQLKYRPVGATTWSNWGTFTVSGKYTHAIRRVYTKRNLPVRQYEVSVQCTNKDGSGDKYSNDIYWTSVSGIIYDDFTYPNKVLVGLKVLATDQLSGGMPRIQWTQTRNNVWVWNPLISAYEQKPANNPAWACYDIIHRCRKLKNIDTGGFEYVVQGIPAERIDYQAFAEWAAFCDDRGIKFNGVIYQTQTLWDALKGPEQAGRGRVLMRGTRFSCVCDAPSEPVQLFNVSNIEIDSFREDFLGTQDRANALELVFFNIDNNYEKTTIPIYGPGYDEATAIENPTQINLDFAMTLEQAYQYGAYQLRVNHYINRMVSWTADIDAIACQVGDVVLVQHDVPRWGYGGRIISATENTVVLDKEVTLSPGITYGIMIRLADDTLIEKTVQGVSEETVTDTLTITETFSTIPQKYDIYSFGEVEKIAKPFRLVSISREGDFRCKLQGVEYIEEVYEEATDIPTIDYTQPAGELTNVRVIQYLDDDYSAKIGISWEPPKIFYGGARIIIDGRQVGRVGSHETSFEYSINHIPEGTKIRIVIEALDVLDNFVDDATVYWTVQAKTTVPEDVTWGECSFTDKIILRWYPVANYDLGGYEVRTDTNFGSEDANLIYKGDETSYIIEFPTKRSYTLYIKAYNRAGVYSANATPITIENAVPSTPPQPVITGFFSSLWIEILPVPDNDILGYKLYMTPCDSSGNPTGEVKVTTYPTAQRVTYQAPSGSHFLVQVSALDVLGEGEKSAPVLATTKKIDSIAEFAQDIIPPRVVNVLPDLPDANFPEGSLVYLTSDGKLYKSTGTTWASAETQIGEGDITETLIADNSISTPKLKANAVTSDKIAANAITAGKIAAGAVGADEIAANAITAEKVGANEIITTSANIRDAVIDDAKIINVEADKITTDRAKITAAQIESIETSQITVGGQPAKLFNPKPEGGRLWHFDRSVVSTDGIQPESGAVYTLRPNEGKFGGAVAVEEGTVNLKADPSDSRNWLGGSYKFENGVLDSDFVLGKATKFYRTEDDNTIPIILDGYPFGSGGIINPQIGDVYTISWTIKYVGCEVDKEETSFIIRQYERLEDGTVEDHYTNAIETIWEKGNIVRYSAKIEVRGVNGSSPRYVVPIFNFLRLKNFNYETDYILVGDIQLEAKPFATSFVDGTRANGKLQYPVSLSQNEGTICGWFLVDSYKLANSTSPAQGLFTIRRGTGTPLKNWFQYTFRRDRLALQYRNRDSTVIINNDIAYTDNIDDGWHQFGIRWNGDTVDVFMDGIVLGSVQYDADELEPFDTLQVGSRDNVDAYNSLIDELLILPYAATEEEIQAWYNSGAPFMDSEEVVSGGKTIINSEGLKAYDSKGNKTVDIGSETGDAFFRGAVIGAVYNE